MDQCKRNPKLILKNSLFLFFRMLFVMLLGFYFVRISLNILGEEDYGIYNIIGTITSMFAIISMPITNSIRRFANVELSKNCNTEQSVFSASVALIVLLVIFIFISFEIIGVYVINNIIVLPEGKEYTANIVYQITILNTIVTFLSIPYQALLNAKEKLGITAATEVFISVFKLVFIFLIPFIEIDFLISYSLIYLSAFIIVLLFYYVYFKKNYSYLHYTLKFDKILFREMTSFSLWNSIESFSGIVLTYGTNFLINIFGGVIYNTVYAISKQVSNAINSFSLNILKAVEPQITSSHINNDNSYKNQLVIWSVKITCLIIGYIAVFFYIEGEYLLTLWLVEVPKEAFEFCFITILSCLFTSINIPIQSLIIANGIVKRFYLYYLVEVLLAMPIMYFILKINLSMIYSMYILVLVEIIRNIYGLVEVKRLMDFPVILLLKGVFRCFGSLILSTALLVFLYNKYGTQSIILQAFVSVVVFIFISYIITLNKLEKDIIKKKILHFINI